MKFCFWCKYASRIFFFQNHLPPSRFAPPPPPPPFPTKVIWSISKDIRKSTKQILWNWSFGTLLYNVAPKTRTKQRLKTLICWETLQPSFSHAQPICYVNKQPGSQRVFFRHWEGRKMTTVFLLSTLIYEGTPFSNVLKCSVFDELELWSFSIIIVWMFGKNKSKLKLAFSNETLGLRTQDLHNQAAAVTYDRYDIKLSQKSYFHKQQLHSLNWPKPKTTCAKVNERQEMDITGNGCKRKRKPVKMQIRFRCVRLKCCGSLERSVKRGCSFIVQKNEITRFSMFLFESLSKPTRKKPSFLKSHINRSLQHFHISFRLT